MPLSEFDIIARFFSATPNRDDVVVGIGDDAAVVKVPDGHQVVVDMSAATEGVDFQPGDPAAALGHGLLARALTRLAARGAEPAWATLVLTLPSADETWLADFSRGLLSLAKTHGLQLIGGDTTRGPCTLILHSHGLMPAGQCTAGTARPGELLYVTGNLGDTALALLHLTGELQLPKREREQVLAQLRFPQPPVAAGIALRGLAGAAGPLTGGLADSVAALLLDSRCGATIHVEQLPVSAALHSMFDRAGGWSAALNSPEPCALCFTVPPERQVDLEQRFASNGLDCTWVGMIEAQTGVRCLLDDGSEL